MDTEIDDPAGEVAVASVQRPSIRTAGAEPRQAAQPSPSASTAVLDAWDAPETPRSTFQASQPPMRVKAPEPKARTVDEEYGIVPMPIAGYRLKPGTGTEIARRDIAKAIAAGDHERARKIAASVVDVPGLDPLSIEGAGAKSWEAVGQGFKQVTSSLVNTVGAGAAAFDLATGAGGPVVDWAHRFDKWVREDAASNDVQGGNVLTTAYYDALKALPGFATQLAAGYISGGVGGFAVGGGVLAGGGQYGQSLQEYMDAGYSRRDAERNALIDGGIATAVTAATEAVGGKLLLGGASKAAVQAGRAAVAKAVGLGVVRGAMAEGAQEFAQQIATDGLVTLRKVDEPAFREYFRQHPDIVAETFHNAMRAGAAGMIFGGAGGGLVRGMRQIDTQEALRAEKPGGFTRPQADSMTEDEAVQLADHLAARDSVLPDHVAADTAFQRIVGAALDLSQMADADLARIVERGNKGESARMRSGGVEGAFAVTPAMAADELSRRSPAGRGAPLDVNEDGTVSQEAVTAWVRSNPDAAGEIVQAGRVSRSAMSRIAGRQFGGNSASARDAFTRQVADAVAEVRDGPVRAASDLLSGVKADDLELARRGLSPATIALVRASEPFTPSVRTDGPQEALAQIARWNKIEAQDVQAVTDLTDEQREVAEFARQRGLEPVFFRTSRPVATRGATHSGRILINADIDRKGAMFAVAVHEVMDALHMDTPEARSELEAVLREHAPQALEAARAKYRHAHEVQGSGVELTDADMQREGGSYISEALFDAFDLHLAIDGDGNWDASKARSLVGANPGALARFTSFVYRVLESLGLPVKARGMNARQAARLSEFVGRNPRELARPEVRNFIADALGRTLDAAKKNMDRGSATQSVGPDIGDSQPAPEPEKPAVDRTKAANDMRVRVRSAAATIQRRIDLAYAMGRRSGLVAGEIEGQKQATVAERRAARRLAEANARAERKMRDALEDAEKRGQKRIDLAYAIGRNEGLSAGQVEGQKTGRKEGRKIEAAEQAEAKKTALEAIQMLPRDERGAYVEALSRRMKPKDLVELLDRVDRALAVLPLVYARSDIASMLKRVRKATAKAETKASAKAMLKEAKALLSGPTGGRPAFTTHADLSARLAAAQEKIAAASKMVADDRADFKAIQERRAKAVVADAKGMVEAIGDKPTLPEPSDPTKGYQRGLVKRVIGSVANQDMATFVAENGGWEGAFGTLFSALRADKSARMAERVKVEDDVRRVLARHGMKDLHEYARRAMGALGDASLTVIETTLGGERVDIPLGHALALAAMDEATLDTLDGKQGMRFAGSKQVVYPTAAEVKDIRRGLGSEMMKMVAGVKDAAIEGLTDRVYEANWRLHGETQPKVDGYFPRRRDIEGKDITIESDPASLARTVATRIGAMQERTGGRDPYVVGDFIETVFGHVDDALYLIHQAENAQRMMRALRSGPVQRAMERVYGQEMNDGIRTLLLNGLDLTGRQTDIASKLTGNVAAALLNMNVRTAGKQLGGVARLFTEAPSAAAWAKGLAKMAAMTVGQRRSMSRDIAERSGYFAERWRQSMASVAASVIGDHASGGQFRDSLVAAMRESAKQAGSDAVRGRILSAAKNIADSGKSLVGYMRSLDGMLRWVDQQIAASAVLMYESAGYGRAEAVAMAEKAFQRTQNSSDNFDDTIAMAKAKYERSAWRYLLPFSSDALKAHNQVRRAWQSGDPKEWAKASFAVGANSAWAAGVVAGISIASRAAVKAVDGGEDDDVIDDSVTDSAARKAGMQAGADAAGAAGGYVGLLLAAAADAYLSKGEVDFSGNVLALRALEQVGRSASDVSQPWGRYSANIALAASMLAGIPVATPIRTVERTASEAAPDTDALILQYGRIKNPTAAQKRRLAELKRQRDADYRESKRTGDMTKKQRQRYNAEQRRREQE